MELELSLKCSECGGKFYKTQSVYPEDVADDMQNLIQEAIEDGWILDYENETIICEVCEEERKRKGKEIPEKIQTKVYLHSSKESNWDMLDELEEEHGFTFPEDAKDDLLYMLYEVCFDIEIYPRTGGYKILGYKE